MVRRARAAGWSQACRPGPAGGGVAGHGAGPGPGGRPGQRVPDRAAGGQGSGDLHRGPRHPARAQDLCARVRRLQGTHRGRPGLGDHHRDHGHSGQRWRRQCRRDLIADLLGDQPGQAEPKPAEPKPAGPRWPGPRWASRSPPGPGWPSRARAKTPSRRPSTRQRLRHRVVSRPARPADRDRCKTRHPPRRRIVANRFGIDLDAGAVTCRGITPDPPGPRRWRHRLFASPAPSARASSHDSCVARCSPRRVRIAFALPDID